MDYRPRDIISPYPGLGEVQYEGFVFDWGNDEYLLEWANTSVYEFGNNCYDHIEIATNSLLRVVSAGLELVEHHDLSSQNLTLFLADNEKYRQLARDLIENRFPRHYQPFPDDRTLKTHDNRSLAG